MHEVEKSEPIRTAAMVAKKIILLQKVDEQVRREAKERQKEYHGNQYESAVGSNLTQVQKDTGRTAEIMAAKLNISKNTYKDMKTIVESNDAEKCIFISRGFHADCV